MISWFKFFFSINILRWVPISSTCYNFGRNVYWSAVHHLRWQMIRFACFDNPASQIVLYICRKACKKPYELQVIPFHWMDESVNHQKWLLRASDNAMAYGPHYFNGIQSVKAVRLPDINCRSFTNTRISITSSSVVLNDKEALIERALFTNQNKFDYSGGHIILHRTKNAIVRICDALAIERGIFLGGNGSFNYYHWLIEILPKLQYLDDLPEQFINYPLLVSEDIEQIPTFKETIVLFAPGRKLIILKKNLSYSVGNLIYIDSPSNLPFNLRKDEKFDLAYSLISRHSITYIRDVVLANMKIGFANSNHSKKLFFSRTSERRKYNKEDVLECFLKFGFEEVFMEDISFEEQVSLMHNADVIAGPTGAVWTNMIFCRPGTKGLCWMAEEFGDFSAFSTIANLVDVDLRYVTYKAGVNSTSELYSKDYLISKMLQPGPNIKSIDGVY